MFKLVLEKAEEPEIKLPTSAGSSKKQEISRKTSISALLTMPKPLTVWITINWKILKEMGIPISWEMTCLLRYLYAGQEATLRTGHGTTDWFQIGKGIRQGCILSSCLFNLYAEYITRNARLDESQAGIKISGRSISRLESLAECWCVHSYQDTPGSQRKKHWSRAAEQSLELTWAGNGSFLPVSVERPLNVTGIEWSPQ